MSEFLHLINNTPVPNLLLIFGGVLLFLAFVGKFGTYVELPPERQRLGGIVGAILVIVGTSITVLPELLSVRGSQIDEGRSRSNHTGPNLDMDDNSGLKDQQSGPETKEVDSERVANLALYSGPLEHLLPDTKYLPIGNYHRSKDGKYTLDDLVGFSRNGEEALFILQDSGIQTIWRRYSSVNCGQTYTNITSYIYYVNSVDKSLEYYNHLFSDAKDNPKVFDLQRVNSRLGEGYTGKTAGSCSFTGVTYNTSAYWRLLQRRNILFIIKLEARNDQVDVKEVEQLSRKIITHMAGRLR